MLRHLRDLRTSASLAALLSCGACEPVRILYDPPPGRTFGGADDAVEVDVSHPVLDFGDISVGDIRSLDVRVSGGGEPLTLLDIRLEGDDGVFSVDGPLPLLVPIESVDLMVTFAPRLLGARAATMLLEVRDSPAVELELVGNGTSGLLVVEPSTIDLGPTWLGCVSQEPFIARNEGNELLEVRRPEWLSTSSDLELELVGDFPMLLFPGEEAPLGYIIHEASSRGGQSGSLVVGSDEGPVSEVRVPVEAEGVEFGRQIDSFTVMPEHHDIVMLVNRSADMSGHISAFMGSVRSLAWGLEPAGHTWHLAVVVAEDGCVRGPYPTINSSFDTAGIERALGSMLGSEHLEYPRRDLAILERAVSGLLTGPGGCNQDLLRNDTILHLVGISNEKDRSPYAFDHYLDRLKDLRPEPGHLVVHAVGGPLPGGCSGAEPYEGLAEAAQETGGEFFSICGAHWGELLEQLGASIALGGGRGNQFNLRHEPVPGTINVTITGENYSDDWRWEPSDNSIRFRPGLMPPVSAVIEVEYVLAGECD